MPPLSINRPAAEYFWPLKGSSSGRFVSFALLVRIGKISPMGMMSGDVHKLLERGESASGLARIYCGYFYRLDLALFGSDDRFLRVICCCLGQTTVRGDFWNLAN